MLQPVLVPRVIFNPIGIVKPTASSSLTTGDSPTGCFSTTSRVNPITSASPTVSDIPITNTGSQLQVVHS